MNAPLRKIAAWTGAALMGGALSGCIGASNPETDPTSPLAPRIQAIVDANREYPRWADFPKSTEPLPAPAEIAARVGTLGAANAELAGAVSRLEWDTPTDAEALAAETRARVNAVTVAPATQETQAEIEEFARRTRERGRAPPPVDRPQ